MKQHTQFDVTVSFCPADHPETPFATEHFSVNAETVEAAKTEAHRLAKAYPHAAVLPEPIIRVEEPTPAKPAAYACYLVKVQAEVTAQKDVTRKIAFPPRWTPFCYIDKVPGMETAFARAVVTLTARNSEEAHRLALLHMPSLDIPSDWEFSASFTINPEDDIRRLGEKECTPMQEARAHVARLLNQLYQMQDMFDDEDGAIQEAIEDAEGFMARKHTMYLLIDEQFSGEFEIYYNDAEATAEKDKRNSEHVSIFEIEL